MLSPSFQIPPLLPRLQYQNLVAMAEIDPFSNAVWLGDHSDGVELLDVFRSGSFPSTALAAFLHEGTHHRCFDSPVGTALLAIEGLSRLAWIQQLGCRKKDSGQQNNECGRNPICFNRALVQAILKLLRPLAEGLALYGELDASPGTSRAASSTMNCGLRVFFEKRMRGTKDLLHLYGEFAKWLAEERSTNRTFINTLNLLESGEQEEFKRPYITGYRLVRKLVAIIHKHCPAARSDTDMTLAFLCAWFFDDWQLANRLAHASWSILHHIEPSQSLEEVSAYLASRIQQLCDGDVAAWYDEYETKLVSGNSRSCEFLNYSPVIEKSVIEFAQQAAGVELHVPEPKLLGHRHLFRFGMISVDEMTLSNGPSFRCRIGDFTFERPALPGGLTLGSETTVRWPYALLEFVLWNFEPYVCAFFNDSLIGVLNRSLEPISGPVAESVFGNCPTFLRIEWFRKRYLELLNPPQGTTCQAYLERRLRHVDALLEAIYGD